MEPSPRPPSWNWKTTVLPLCGLLLWLAGCGAEDFGDAPVVASPKADDGMDYFAPPLISELVRNGQPIQDAACQLSRRSATDEDEDHQDGLWCGSSLAASATDDQKSAPSTIEPDALYFCAGGQTHAKVTCGGACRAAADVAGRDKQGNPTTFKNDGCAMDQQMIVIGLQQQRLRYCDGTTQFEHGVSTGAPGYETWNPRLAGGGGKTGNYRFSIGIKYLVRQMLSPFSGEYYNARLPWSMNLRTSEAFITYEYLHASPSCSACGRPSADGTGVSHGCVNQLTADARRLYMLTPPGTPVHLADELPAHGCIGCNSATLGRIAESFACVQTASQTWFICTKGRWFRTTDRSKCSFEYPFERMD